MAILRKIFSNVSGKPEQLLKNEALRKAAIKGKAGRVRKLLDEGAEVDYRDIGQLTPLYFAASHGFNDIVRLLLERGANPDVGKDADLEGSALTQAAYWGHLDVVKTLVEFKANLNLRGYELRSALHEAIWKGHEEIASFLIAAGTKTDNVSRLGSTPFQDAVTNGLRPVALVLAQHGADADVADKRGFTIRENARTKGWDDVVEAIDKFKWDKENAHIRTAENEQRTKKDLDAALEEAPVLQSDLTIKRRLILKPGH